MQGSKTGVSILDRIVREKLREIAELASHTEELEAGIASAPRVRDFRAAVSDGGRVALIAEVKRRSPGAGEIRPGLDPAQLARDYEVGGASAVSVLTDAKFFGGSLADLTSVRSRVDLPVLRKDFLLDERQLLEARGSGADAILLIVRLLDDGRLAALIRHAEVDLGMTALVEAHDGTEVDRALAAGAGVIGINNRDLSDFTTNIDVTLGLIDRVPSDVVLISESGISSPEQVQQLGAVGVDAILVGEALLRESTPADGARRLTGHRSEDRRVET